MCKFYVAKLLFLQKSAWNICVIQKKAVPLHAFFALYARTRVETILIINKNKVY